ncbi:5-formyltetrahydrofolate cyclo-ligase [Leucobacter ruminantium]|uniref:5-formyltetrahydrofolate cyclo-ligase n=1 Tax=Leucobacter ruminantium TaxID=1289170 RepID=A0A939LYM5_9MICO|nr:5-formyltetrahydrofolate cyclo-ligase [Leucobacter ruminantium]MBO1806536.1 5-formyltetrahydrofolate cyclo-ligase [Leucobacter ruminantium]
MQQHDDIVREKRRIRGEVRARRRALTPEQRRAAGEALTARLAELVESRGARSVSCYLPLPSEPDTMGFLSWAAGRGIEVLLPTSLEGFRLGWIRPDGTGTVAGAHGITEPRGELLPEGAIGEVDLMLIPASAVDTSGMRLGWGLGYFDRCLDSLERRPPVFAVVHDGDVLDRVPAEAHDSPVTGAVTPTRVLFFG